MASTSDDHARHPARRAAPQPARRARRLPLPRRAGDGHLRRQGEVDPQARRRPLHERQGRGRDARRDRDGQPDPPDRVPARRLRGRGAADREPLHQGVQAALQRPPARRQVLSVPRDLARRGLPARVLHARAPSQGSRVLRPVLERQEGPRHARPAAEGLRVSLVPGRRARPAQRIAVPGLLHQALRRALRRLPVQGGVPRGDRRRHRLPLRPLSPDRARPRAPHEGGRGRGGVRAGRARAQPPASRQEPARAPARRQRVGRHARRDRRSPSTASTPTRRSSRSATACSRTASPSTSPTRPGASSARSRSSSSCSTTTRRWRSRRRSSSSATSRTPSRSARRSRRDAARRSRCARPSAATSAGSSSSPSATRSSRSTRSG